MLFHLLPACAALFAVAGGTLSPAPVPAPSPGPAAAHVLYRIETAGRGILWSADHPLQSGDQVTFHLHPGGALVSLRRSEVKRVSAQSIARTRGYIDVGPTAGDGNRSTAVAEPAGRTGAEGALPGARADGTALFNPDRPYRPDIDSKQVPGSSVGYPNSPNDYREGRTLAFPAPSAVQAAPGEPPRMPAGNGEVPKGKQ